MCLIAFAWRAHHRYPLALIANRDEFHLRPSAAAGFDYGRTFDLLAVIGHRKLSLFHLL